MLNALGAEGAGEAPLFKRALPRKKAPPLFLFFLHFAAALVGGENGIYQKAGEAGLVQGVDAGDGQACGGADVIAELHEVFGAFFSHEGGTGKEGNDHAAGFGVLEAQVTPAWTKPCIMAKT